MSMDDPVDFSVGLLRMIAKELQALTPEQRRQVSDGVAKLKLVVEAGNARKEVSASTSLKANELRSKLEECKSRDEARKILHELKLSKKELQRISRELDLPVPRDDDAERLIDRIVESVVGFRLRSMAIQGKAEDGAQPKEPPPQE